MEKRKVKEAKIMAAKEQAELTIQLQREEFRKKEAASEMKRKTFEDARA